MSFIGSLPGLSHRERRSARPPAQTRPATFFDEANALGSGTCNGARQATLDVSLGRHSCARAGG
jgi:hypothetical protein